MILVTGGDLARIYAAAYHSSPDGKQIAARNAVSDFLAMLSDTFKEPVHVGDPMIWDGGRGPFG